MKEQVVDLQLHGKTAVVTINRPNKRNAVNTDILDGLIEVSKIIKQKLPRAVVLTGKGDKAFCAGFDVNPQDNPMAQEFADAVLNKNPETTQKTINRLRHSIDEFMSIPVPLIAAINGIAYGGGAEIAARCDLAIMNQSAEICFSEVKLGLMPDFGGGAKLAKLIGPSKAAYLILTAKKIYADEALSLGLVNQVSKNNNALKDALKLAEQIAENGPNAVMSSLSVIRECMNKSFDELLAYEKEKAVSLILKGEAIHGVLAFMEKKQPVFPDPE